MWAHVGRGGLFVFWVLRRLRRASVGRMAASLAFTTLLGIVPLFTVVLPYVARFPVFERWLDTDCLRSARGLPRFLIWIYVSWVILLLGAAVTATLAERGGKARNRWRRA